MASSDLTNVSNNIDSSGTIELTENNQLVQENTSIPIGDLFISFCIALAIGYITIKLKR